MSGFYSCFIEHPERWRGKTILVFDTPNKYGRASTCLATRMISRERHAAAVASRVIGAHDTPEILRAWFDAHDGEDER